MFAVQSGVPEVVRYLFSKGADSDVNSADNVSSSLSLRFAVKLDRDISLSDNYHTANFFTELFTYYS